MLFDYVMPGFEFIRSADNSSFDFRVGRIRMWDGSSYVFHMIRPQDKEDFLVSRICDAEEKVLWDFRDVADQGVIAFPAYSEDERVVALVGKGRGGNVEEVIFFSCGGVDSTENINDYRRTLFLKQGAAQYLGLDCQLNNEERWIALSIIEECRKARERAAEEKARERRAGRARILARTLVTVYTKKGVSVTGLPVLNGEWSLLPHETNVVVVENYDDQTGDVSEPIEAFRIIRTGKGAKKSDRLGGLSFEPPSTNNGWEKVLERGIIPTS